MRQPSIMKLGPIEVYDEFGPFDILVSTCPAGFASTGQRIGLGPAPLSIPTARILTPQPPSASLLLTPPLSRHASPHFVIPSPTSDGAYPAIRSATRGRSRSRSRSKSRTRIEFDTEGSNAALCLPVRAASARTGPAWREMGAGRDGYRSNGDGAVCHASGLARTSKSRMRRTTKMARTAETKRWTRMRWLKGPLRSRSRRR